MTLNTPSSVRLGVRPMISRTLAYSSPAFEAELAGEGLVDVAGGGGGFGHRGKMCIAGVV